LAGGSAALAGGRSALAGGRPALAGGGAAPARGGPALARDEAALASGRAALARDGPALAVGSRALAGAPEETASAASPRAAAGRSGSPSSLRSGIGRLAPALAGRLLEVGRVPEERGGLVRPALPRAQLGQTGAEGRVGAGHRRRVEVPGRREERRVRVRRALELARGETESDVAGRAEVGD